MNFSRDYIVVNERLPGLPPIIIKETKIKSATKKFIEFHLGGILKPGDLKISSLKHLAPPIPNPKRNLRVSIKGHPKDCYQLMLFLSKAAGKITDKELKKLAGGKKWKKRK